MKVYNQRQKEEFAADINSLLLPEYNPKKRGDIFESALLWFGCLDLFEVALDTLYPQSPWIYQSHPTAKERFENVLSNVPVPDGVDIKTWRQFQETIKKFKLFLIKDVSDNIDFYEMYGSAYLDEPNTKWRGPELIDRVDYY